MLVALVTTHHHSEAKQAEQHFTLVVVAVVARQAVLVEAVAVAVEPLLELQTQAAVAVETTQLEATTAQLAEAESY